MNRTVIVSTGAENGYPNHFMISVIKDGKLASQSVVGSSIIPVDGAFSGSEFLTAVKRINANNSDYHWISRLSLSRLNKTSKAPVFGRNKMKTLIPLV